MRRLLCTALLGAIACDAEKPSGPSQACVDAVAAFDASIATIPRAGRNVPAISFQGLVALDAAVPAADDVEGSPLLVVTHRRGLAVEGDNLPSRTVAELKPGLARELETHAARGRAGRVLVFAQWDTRGSVMTTLFEALRETDVTEVDVLFVRDAELPGVPESSVAAALAELPADGLERMTGIGRIIEPIVVPCPTLVALLEAPPSDGSTPLLGAGEALLGCDCKADPAALASIVHVVSTPRFLPAVVRLQLAPKGAAVEPLVLDRDATWLEVHRTVVDARDRPLAFAWK